MNLEKQTRALSIVGGIVAAFAGIAILFWAISFFVPRFLRAAGNGRVRLILICAMAIVVLVNVLGRQRKRKAAGRKLR